MPYRSPRTAARRCISTPVGNSLNVCLAASARVLFCYALFSARSKALYKTFKEFPTVIEIQHLTAALRDLYGIP